MHNEESSGAMGMLKTFQEEKGSDLGIWKLNEIKEPP